MDTTDKSINKIITTLFELEAKGYHSIFFEYENGLFRVRIMQLATEKIVYERTINTLRELEKVVETLETIKNICLNIWKTPFKCYMREFILGEKVGNWEKTRSIIELGDNATQAMLADDSGYYIDDPDNHLQYFVCYKELSESEK